jgi:hypothetical protein
MCKLPLTVQEIKMTVSQDDAGDLKKKEDNWNRQEKTTLKLCGDCASKHFAHELIGFILGRISVKP